MKKLLIIGILLLVVFIIGFVYLNQSSSNPGGANPDQPDTGVNFQDINPTFNENDLTITDTPVNFPEPATGVEIQRLPETIVLSDLIVNEPLEREPTEAFERILAEFWFDVLIPMQCTTPDGIEEVMLITAKWTQDPVENHLRNAYSAMIAWEGDMIKDIGHRHFDRWADYTQFRLTKAQDVGPMPFRKLDYTNDEVEHTLYYGWLLNYVLIAKSVQCLEAAQYEIYAPHAH